MRDWRSDGCCYDWQPLMCFLIAYEVVIREYLFQTWFKHTWLTRSHHLCKKYYGAVCLFSSFWYRLLVSVVRISLLLTVTAFRMRTFKAVTSIYPCVCMHVCLCVSLGKSRQWDPWLQRPSCHSKSQSHLWHWAPWSYYLWTFVHHLPGWERGETRECGRGKHTDRMLLFLHARQPYAHTVVCIKRRHICHTIHCFAEFSFSGTKKWKKSECTDCERFLFVMPW